MISLQKIRRGTVVTLEAGGARWTVDGALTVGTRTALAVHRTAHYAREPRDVTYGASLPAACVRPLVSLRKRVSLVKRYALTLPVAREHVAYRNALRFAMLSDRVTGHGDVARSSFGPRLVSLRKRVSLVKPEWAAVGNPWMMTFTHAEIWHAFRAERARRLSRSVAVGRFGTVLHAVRLPA